MSQIGNISSRTTLLMTSNGLMSSLRRTQRELLDRQNEISTGLAVRTPSDDPAHVATILALEQRVETREQLQRNLQHSLSVLNNTDQALNDAFDLLIEAKNVALSQIDAGSDTQTRQSMTTVVDAQIHAAMEIGNRHFQGASLFGGRRSVGDPNGDVFVEFLGGIRYVGQGEGIAGDIGLNEDVAFTSNAVTAFGALSARVRGRVDLDPQATASTRLQDLNGAQGRGVRSGSVSVIVDGQTVTVDLTSAQTLGDVVTRVNDTIQGIDPTAGDLSIVGSALVLTANAGHTVRIDDLGEGATAADLGIAMTATGTSLIGTDLDPRLTELSQLSSLGGAMDMTSGLQVTQGGTSVTLDLSNTTTIQDLMNVINRQELGLRLEINEDATGLDLISDVSGLELSIGENGGTTATDLGLRTFDTTTQLSDFNFGFGVSTDPGKDDFSVELHDGSSFAVSLEGATTVGQVLDRVRQAAVDAGLSVGQPGDGGTDFNLGLVTNGNGMQFDDNTTGTGDFRVISLGTSQAAANLGIEMNTGLDGSFVSDDLAKVRVEGVFTHMIQLRHSLGTDDSRGIRFAGDGLEGDLDQMSQARADVAVRAQRVERQQDRNADMDLAEQTVLSGLRDADLTEAITRLTQLQQQLEASLRVGSINLQLSLLDFLR